ncbi:hypothetical protein [Roseibacillus ishigakijimensis]|uniref:Uncharacterized protein n=1 Tax=Roseibacillus ishigakijimensis TaxID=454146 RepID=A0A934RM71_9BACT|nr:hypothetical protein [Roseibacillus ishigakijimensis]MBK1833393.1 hypothetical protein [Roseibacillus ishigakijimensis]
MAHDLDDDFEEAPPAAGEKKAAPRTQRPAREVISQPRQRLPPPEDRPQPPLVSEGDIEPGKPLEMEPIARPNLTKRGVQPAARKDELGDLDEQENKGKPAINPVPRDAKKPLSPQVRVTAKPSAKRETPAPAASAPEETAPPSPESMSPEPETPEDQTPAAAAEEKTASSKSDSQTPPPAQPGGKWLAAFSPLEKILCGLFLIALLGGIIATRITLSQHFTPPVEASRLKFPLEGKSLVVANAETYWRNPVREGANRDEGVSRTIELIPEVKLTLGDNSQAKALRLLFRDEEGRFAGDPTTLTLTGSTFALSTSPTAVTAGSTATIRATTGFKQEGDLISYLADDNFTWEFVLMESADGQNFEEFMAIPISAKRKNAQ